MKKTDTHAKLICSFDWNLKCYTRTSKIEAVVLSCQLAQISSTHNASLATPAGWQRKVEIVKLETQQDIVM